MRIAPIFVLLLILAVAGNQSFGADKKQLAAAMAEVDANLKTKAGKDYDEKMGAEFGAKFIGNVRQCKQSSPPASHAPFDMLVKLEASGKMQEVLVYPENALSLCTRTALLAGSFSPPPHSDYWINIHLDVKR